MARSVRLPSASPELLRSLAALLVALTMTGVLVACDEMAVPGSGSDRPPEGPVASPAGSEPDRVPSRADGVATGGLMAADPMGTGLTGTDLDAFLALRYEAFWEAFDQARRFPGADPALDHPALEMLAAGDQLETARAVVAELAVRREGMRESDRPAIADTDTDTEHRVRVEVVDGPRAELVACMVNDDVRYSLIDGTVLVDEVATIESRATMARTDDGWKVIRSRAVARVDGVGGCWLSGDDQFPY